MTDMDRLIEVLNRIADAYEEEEILARFTVCMGLASSRMAGLVDDPASTKLWQEFTRELNDELFSFAIKGEWNEMLEVFVARTEKQIEQLKDLNGKKKKENVNRTQYG